MKKLVVAALVLCLPVFVFAQNAYTHQFDNVTIVRDSFGVPHVFGKTDADAVYGLAWAHCEDDFETIQKNFLSTKGRLGRAEGKDGALFDFFAQLTNVNPIVDSNYEATVSPQHKLLLSAYAKALNDFSAKYPERVTDKSILPFKPQDIVKGYMLSFNLFTALPYYVKIIYKNEMAGIQENMPSGSNAFAVNSSKSADGNTYLVANPHNTFSGQYSWYEAHVNSEEGLNMSGALFPGCIMPSIGFNDSLAWTHTFNYHDLVDIYKLTINPKNKNQYKYDGKWLDMRVETVKLKVRVLGKNGPVITLKRKLYHTVYGPALKADNGTFAMRWSGPGKDLRAGEQWYKMAKAQNYTDWMEAVKMDAIPLMNFIYADKKDNIYMLSQCKIPVRKPGYNWFLVLPGDTSATLWTDYYPMSTRPQYLNPSCGYIYNSNNSPLRATGPDCDLQPSGFSNIFGLQLNPTNRSQRLDELFGDKDSKISMQSLKAIKYDTKFPENSILMNELRKITVLNTDTLPKKVRAYVEGLRNWDRSTDTLNVGASLVMSMFKNLTKGMKVGMEEFFFREMSPPVSSYMDAIKHSRKSLTKHFGSINVPLGTLQRHVRGDKNYAIGGMTDVLAALNNKYQKKKGYYKATHGDSYMLFLSFSPTGFTAESIVPYGSSNVAGSKHYNDQMGLYLQGKAKKALFDRKEIFEKAESIYHPGIK